MEIYVIIISMWYMFYNISGDFMSRFVNIYFDI